MNHLHIPPTTNSNSKKDRWLQAISASAALWLTVCLFGPLLLELAFWPVSDLFAYVITLLLVSLILTILTSLVLVKLMPSQLFGLAAILIVATGFMIYARVFVLPDAVSCLPNTILNIELSKHYLLIGALLMLVSFVAVYLLRHSLLRHISTIAISFITFQIVYACVWYISAPIPQQNGYRLINDYANSFSKSRNVILLVFDSFSGRDFKGLLDYDKNLADCFDGFTFYPDSVGSYSATHQAVAHIMTGLFPENSEPVNEFLRSKLPTESIPGILKNSSFRTEAYGPGAQYPLQALVLDNITNETHLFLNSSDVARVILQFVVRFTPGFARKYWINTYIKTSGGTLYGALWLGTAYDIVKIGQIERLAHPDTSKPVFKYEHFWGAHTPYILSGSMQIRNSSLTLAAQREQAGAAMQLCCRYLRTLKKIGVFDNSTVFVIGDHGRGDQTAFPLMLWKPSNASKPFRVSSRPVAQADIINTICDELGIDLNRDYGESLRDQGNSSRIRRHFVTEPR